MALTSPFVIELTGAEREELENLAAARTAPYQLVQRAAAVLALAGGASSAANPAPATTWPNASATSS